MALIMLTEDLEKQGVTGYIDVVPVFQRDSLHSQLVIQGKRTHKFGQSGRPAAPSL